MTVHRKTKENPNSPKSGLEQAPDENRLLANYEHAPIGIVECSPEGQYISVNEEFCRIIGYDKEKLLKRSIKDISLQEDYAKESKLYEQLIAGETASYKFERRSIRKDGEIIWVEVIRWSVRDVAGNAQYTVGIVQDITDRRRAEAQIEFQARLLENVHDAVITINDKLQITYWNRAAEELYGWTTAEVLGRPILDVVQSELDPEQRAILGQKLLKEPSVVAETIHHHKDGHPMHVEVRGTLLRDNDGQMTGYIIFALDITQRKQVETALRESEELMRRAFGIDTVGIIFFDPEGPIIDANKAFLRMSGYSLEDLQQGRARWDVMTPEEFMPASYHAVHELLTKKETTPYEKQYIRKDSSRWWGLFAAKLVGENRGVEFILDITERKQAQEALERLNLELESRVETRTAELQAANQALMESHNNLRALSQRLVEVQEEERRAIARELHDRVGQNLLAVKLNLGMISDQLSNQAMKAVNTRLADSINLMSEINKLVRDVMTDLHHPVLDDYGLEAALASHLDEFQSRYGIHVDFEQSDPPLPRLSPSLEITLLRIAQEALFNIVKHAHASQVTLFLRQAGGQITLTVQDNGIGIQSLQEADRSGSRGLKIMRERAEAFGGTLRVTSTPGQGTKIEAVIPFNAEDQRNS